GRLDIVAAAARYGGPLLAIHGRDDATVPWAAAERLAQAGPRGASLILDGASHGFDATHPMEHAPEALEAAIGATLHHLEPLS
ncbi:MAG: pimeloyl-ACP methyl ester carboxylesterase, partial [Paracoccaceae bacterium]